MIPLIATVFGASLAGSAHCLAMCSGFLCFACGQDRDKASAWTQAAYHGGRLLAYVLLGVIAGAVGARVDRIGFTGGAAAAAGGLMVAWGLLQLAAALGARVPHPGAPAPLRRLLGALVRVAGAWPPASRSLAVGALSALLPCGWLWAFAATAAGTGSPWKGALVMAVFWGGTVPALAGAGFALQKLLGPLQRRVPLVTASVLVVIGLLTVAGKFQASPRGGAAKCPHCAPADAPVGEPRAGH